MADLLIRGMGLPKDTPNGYQTLLLWYDGEITDLEGNTIARAVKVPDRGRLIDVDAIPRAAWRGEKEDLIDALILAPTIIPASKEGAE